MNSKNPDTTPVIKASLYGKEFVYKDGKWLPAPSDTHPPSKNITRENNRHHYFNHDSSAASREAKTEPTTAREQDNPRSICCIIM